MAEATAQNQASANGATKSTKAAPAGAGRELKKVSADQINLSKQKPGFVLEGTLIGINVREMVDDEGEVKKLHGMVIENAKGERLKFLADAGLRTALEDAMVVKGDWFRAVKGEKIDIGRGRTQNTWDIFQNV